MSTKALFLSNPAYVRNLVCMTIVLVACSFDYYLIGYELKYIRGDIYINGIVSSTAEIFAYIFSGALYMKIGMKNTLCLSFIIAVAGMMALLLTTTDDEYWLSLFILCGKFGISSSFNIAFIGTYYLFPPNIVATALGIENISSRVATIFAPYVAELTPRWISKWVFVGLAVLALVASLLLVIINKKI
jgi:nitrate/nitrite transporter NarK